MDRLLNIKETAELLNVSEMTIRRWTNSGRLKCFRVGGKSERRFKLSDIEDILIMHSDEIPFGLQGVRVPNSSHISHFYTAVDESIEVGVSYIKEGIDRGELVLCVLPEMKRSIFYNEIEKHGLMLDVLEKKGLFTAIIGKTSLEAQSDLIKQLLNKSRAFKGFRLLGDMQWTLDRSWDILKVYELEKLTNEIRAGENSLFLCQYDMTKFSADAAFMAMQTHNYTIYKDHLRASPYFDITKDWIPAD